MSAFYHFRGRGDAAVPPDSLYLLEVADGSVLAITQCFGKVEFLIAYCRMVLADRWGVYCHRPFRRATDPAITRSWAHREKESLFLYRGVRIHLIEEEEWMTRSA